MSNLKESSDVVLVENVNKNNCSDSMSEIIRRHSGICVKIISYYVKSRLPFGPDHQEIWDSKDYVIHQAVKTYDQRKNVVLVTWIGQSMINHCRAVYRKFRLSPRYVYDEDVQQYPAHSQENRLEHQVQLLRKALSEIEDKRIRQAMYMRYFSNTHRPVPYQDIGVHFGVSRQAVINWERSVIKKLHNNVDFFKKNDIIV